MANEIQPVLLNLLFFLRILLKFLDLLSILS